MLHTVNIYISHKVEQNYLKSKNQDSYELSFEEIRNILGFDIDHSFLKYKKELLSYGYEVVKISMKDKKIIFKRVGKIK